MKRPARKSTCTVCGQSGGGCHVDDGGTPYCANRPSGAPKSRDDGDGYTYAHSEKPKLSPEKQREKDAKALERALELGRSATPIDGTPAEEYLRERAIARPRTGWPTMLRFAEHLWYPYEPKENHVGMVAAVGRWDGKAIDLIGVQRTYLEFGGVWLDAKHYDKRKRWRKDDRLNLGKVGGGGVWLIREPSETLYVGEGIETTLSAMEIYRAVAGVAALSAWGVRALVLPPFVRSVIVCADCDRDGIAAAEWVKKEWSRRGIAVEIRKPLKPTKPGYDFNDVLRARKKAGKK